MLGKLDDTLRHQLPSTFDHVGTSDPRFFDRYWFAVYDPHGTTAMQVTMGLYNNMNVLDAGCVVIQDGRQHNLRLSRALRPNFETELGPLSISVERPFEQLHLVLKPSQQPLAFDLTWTADLPPEEERHHFARVRGRVTQEYAKYVQVGHASGWVQAGGRRLEAATWWACRDHSWGVRPGAGVPEPVTGEPTTGSAAGSLFCWLSFSTELVAGSLQLAEQGGVRQYLTGGVHDRRAAAPEAELAVQDASLSFSLFEGTRRFREVTFDVELAGGRRLDIVCEALGPSVAMPGLGYTGWDDNRGLGAYRGAYHEEGESWDVRHPADVLRADGSRFTPPHRMQPVSMRVATADGVDAGTGVLTFIANGSLPHYGLG